MLGVICGTIICSCWGACWNALRHGRLHGGMGKARGAGLLRRARLARCRRERRDASCCDGMRTLEDGSFNRRMRSSIASTSCEEICEEGSWAFHGVAARRPPCSRPPPDGPAASLFWIYGAKALEFPSKNARGMKK